MKRKLTRASIDELKKEMPILSLEDSKKIVGGGNFYIIDENGVVTYSGTMASSGTTIAIGSIDSGKVFRFSGDVEISDFLNGYKMSGSGVGKDLFETMANNTYVEWGMYENSGSGNAFINTSNQYDTVRTGNYSGYDTYYHNHNIDHNPSSPDLDYAAKGYYDMNYIYHEPSNSYVPY